MNVVQRVLPLLSVLLACGQGTGPVLLPPYEGPLKSGQENPTGWPPIAVDVGSAPVVVSVRLHSYEVVLAPGIDWNAADSLAKQMLKNGVPGHLATVTSAAENAIIEELRKAVINGPVWLGGFQLPGSPEPGGGWTWVNGEGGFPGTNGGPEYANWAPGEPNNVGNEQHLTIGHFKNGLWNDQVGTTGGYVVEWDE